MGWELTAIAKVYKKRDNKMKSMETRAYRFRIYPDIKRQKEIDEKLLLAQQFYNKLLEKSISPHNQSKTKISMAQFNKFKQEIITENKDFLKLYSQTLCEIEYRLLKAYQNFFRRCKEGAGKLGFAKFRSRDRYNSITYPQDNGSFSIEKGRLRISRFSGRIQIENHRDRTGKIKTLTIKKEGGEYYAIFTTEREVEPPKPEVPVDAVGIDFGIHNFIATSDGQRLEKPQFMRKAQKKIALWQRRMERRTKRGKNRKLAGTQSKRREKAKEKLNEAYSRSTRQNEDYMHKLSDNLVRKSGYNLFIAEDLRIQNMIQNHHLARSIANCAWGGFRMFTEYKSHEEGKHFMLVPAENSTQECSACGNVKKGKDKLSLKDRIYDCQLCGLTLDRDVNAARVILKRGLATFGLKGSNNAQGDETSAVHASAPKSSVWELRTDKTPPMHEGRNLP